ncbi:MAG: hypothetical protein ACPG4K_10100 [Haloferula sp.]
MSKLLRLLPFLGLAAFVVLGMLFMEGKLTPRSKNCWDPDRCRETVDQFHQEPHLGHEAFLTLLSTNRNY